MSSVSEGFHLKVHLILKKYLSKHQGQILTLRSSKVQKGKKKSIVKNSYLSINQQEFLRYLPYLLSYTHLSGGILFSGKLHVVTGE